MRRNFLHLACMIQISPSRKKAPISGSFDFICAACRIRTGDLPPLSLHGLRRSFGTLSEWVEVPAGIVAQIM